LGEMMLMTTASRGITPVMSSPRNERTPTTP
jgi:hypothetical protein